MHLLSSEWLHRKYDGYEVVSLSAGRKAATAIVKEAASKMTLILRRLESWSGRTSAEKRRQMGYNRLHSTLISRGRETMCGRGLIRGDPPLHSSGGDRLERFAGCREEAVDPIRHPSAPPPIAGIAPGPPRSGPPRPPRPSARTPAPASTSSPHGGGGDGARCGGPSGGGGRGGTGGREAGSTYQETIRRLRPHAIREANVATHNILPAPPCARIRAPTCTQV